MGRRDRHEGIGGICPLHRDGGSRVGCQQVGAYWLWYQEIANHSRRWLVALLEYAAMDDDHFPEDELVSLDELQEKLTEFEDYVQSSDVAAMQSGSFFVGPLSSNDLSQNCSDTRRCVCC